MGQRPTDDGLASAYASYLATWLHSWPLRRRLEQRRRQDAAQRRALAREAQIHAFSADGESATPAVQRYSEAS